MIAEVGNALRDLLQGQVPKPIVPAENADEAMFQLCQTTNSLIKSFADAHDFILALGQGNLDAYVPPRNLLISPYKQLHANLKHLTWQTQQVANGDFSQRVDFMGAFSEAFNSMIDSLKEKKRAETALAESERRLELALQGADLGLWDVDLRTQAVTFNRRWAEMLGHSLDEIEPTVDSWMQLVHPEDAAGLTQVWNAHLEGKIPFYRFEYRMLAKSGQWKWILSLGKVVEHDSHGKPLRIAGTHLDISERKQLELRLAQRAAELRDANSKIMASLRYARTIQLAFLPDAGEMAANLGDFFVIWKAKDIVSGDLYLFRNLENGFLISVMDCTGHGVPGAMMTMIAGSSLSRVLHDAGYDNPALILRKLNELVQRSLNQQSSEASSNDGLDMGLCYVDRARGLVTFAGARIYLYYSLHGEIHEVRGDRQSIGYKSSDPYYEYTNHSIPFAPPMRFYMSTDGITDQTGGPKGLPFGRSQFKRLLREHHEKPMTEQKSFLEQEITAYRGDEVQVDDMTVVGFTI